MSLTASFRLRAVTALLLAVPAAPALAQSAANWPNKPIRLIVANTAGSSVDTLSRTLAARLGEALGQQIVVDNRSGAGGTIGAEIAASALADGHTLLVTSTGVQVISPQIYRKLNYHPVNDFAPVSLWTITQNMLVTHPSLPVATVKDLVALARAQPGKLNMANAGSGFQSHLAGVLFTHMAGIDLHHVPYKGTVSLIAVIGNESQLTFAPGPSVIGHVRAGRMKALATGGEKRSQVTPELPTVIESGIPGFVSTGWTGLMAPKATPRPILDKLHATLTRVIADPQTREALERQGGEPLTTSPAEMVRFFADEYRRFGQAIKLANLTLQ